MDTRRGFTLVEVLVYVGVFTIVSGLMVGVLDSVTKVQNRESAKNEVVQQSQFVMGAIKRAISESSLIDISNDTAVTTLTLRTEDNSKDPTSIYASGGIVYKKETSGGTAIALSNSKVSFDSLTFTKTANPPGPDTVRIDFSVSYNSSDAALSYSRDFRSAVARVSAVTFDSDLLPASDNTYNVGSSDPKWLNGYFSGAVSVGTLLNLGSASSDPSGANGAIYYNTTDNVFRGYKAGAWADLGASSGDGVWTTSGSNAYRTSGSVGIGTSSLTERLHVDGNIIQTAGDRLSTDEVRALSASGLKIYDDSGSAGLFIEDGGQVGIGDTSPDHQLDVAGNIGLDASSYINFGDTDGTSGYGFRDNSGTVEYKDSGGSWTAFSSAGSGTVNSGTATYFPYYASTGTALTATSALVLSSSNIGVASTTPFAKLGVENTGTGLSFAVNDVANDSSPFVIDADGNVGIGTRSPNDKLHIVGTNAYPLRLERTSAGAVDVGFASTISGDSYDLKIAPTLSNTGIAIHSRDGSGLVNALMINYNGYVGLGTVSPDYNLTFIDDAKIGLDGGGYFDFDDQSTDEINFVNLNVGIGSSTPSALLSVAGVIRSSGDISVTSSGTYELTPSDGTLNINGDVVVNGDLQADSKNFVHKLDDGRVVTYVSLEGPEHGTYIRGSSRLDAGEIRINLPEYFSIVTEPKGVTVQVTLTSDSAKGLYVAERNNKYIIVKELGGGKTEASFDYLVQGVRIGRVNYDPWKSDK